MDRGDLWATRKITPSLYLPGPLPVEVIFQGAGFVIKNSNLFTILVTPSPPHFSSIPNVTINYNQLPLEVTGRVQLLWPEHPKLCLYLSQRITVFSQFDINIYKSVN